MQVQPQFQVYNASAGSGKTFTLVKEYLKILLSKDDIYLFQKILAVTFTNKAAAEMKDRVLENLKVFSGGGKNDMAIAIVDELCIKKEILIGRSKRVLKSILWNYSAFNITTIDSFTYRIIRNFAFDLGLSMNFDVEMDSTSLLDEAVDLMISKIGTNDDLSKVLIDFSIEKTEDDKSWDITRELKDFAKVLLNENHSSQLKKLNNKTLKDFTELKIHLRKENQTIENEFVDIGKRGIAIMDKFNIQHNSFSYSDLPNFFKKLIKINKLKFDEIKFTGRLNDSIVKESLYSQSNKKISIEDKIAIDNIKKTLIDLYNCAQELYNKKHSKLIKNRLVLKSLIPLAVLKYINTSLNEIKEQNNVYLNAEFNQIISEQIRNEPAPFIYERLGEKYHYYFIDEMQDTSVLQWTNLIPLIENALISETLEGEKGKLMLVGDAKQSIYRWRGGKAEQFIDITTQESSFSVEKSPVNLGVNFRSSKQIVDFNNNFFVFVADFLENQDYRNIYKLGSEQNVKHEEEEGYVEVSFVEEYQGAEEGEVVYGKKILEKIQNLDPIYELNDVCVLVRTKKQGIAVSNYLTSNKINIISSETLLLKNSKKVDFIINLLRFIALPNDKEAVANLLYFLCEGNMNSQLIHDVIKGLIHEPIETLFEEINKQGHTFDYNEFIQLPFYDSIEYVIRSFTLIKETDAYLFAFLDFVLEYQSTNGKGIESFLENWKKKKETLSISIPEGKEAVHIMTIHKSKGLEFPIVIFPFDMDIYRELNPRVWLDFNVNDEMLGFETTLIEYSKKLNYAGNNTQQLYDSRKREKQLDNLNLLYVALTRAEEQLYILTERKTKSNNLQDVKYFSDLFIEYLKSIEGTNAYSEMKNIYDFGNKKRQRASKKRIKSKEQKEFISTSWKDTNISVSTNSSLLWENKQGEAINYGNLLHEILSRITTENDIEESVEQYFLNGIINSNQALEINEIINKVVNHPQLKDYFQTGQLVFNEQEIITADKKLQIPDKMIFKEKEVIILDYKTGKSNQKHIEQVNNYADTLTLMGYKVQKKVLVYIEKLIKVQEVI